MNINRLSISSTPNNAPHIWAAKHWNQPTWCKFCTKFIWGLGYQGFHCKACKYPAHTKCYTLVPHNCPAQEIKDPNSKKNIKRDEVSSMLDLAVALKHGVEIKERRILLKTYNNCFVGSEAVDWMIQNLPIRDREEAVLLGMKLLDRGYFKHIEGKGQFKDDKGSFYEFQTKDNVVEKVEGREFTSPEVSVDDFEIIKTVGKGGFAMVCKVKKKDTGKIYAMKMMNKNKVSGQRQLQCLIAEKNIMLNDNPFLVHLYFSFQTEDKLYFVMDYISGGDLAYHLEKRGKFPEKEARFILGEIVLALAHLHSCGIVYRDLKLENVLLDKEGHVCLTDFGLSKELENISSTTKTVCGTPTYLAPEVLLGQPYGNAIDWWSLGVVCYELFTGGNPFDASDFDSVLNNILHSAILVPEFISKEGKSLILSLLQRNPKNRLCSGPTGSAEIQNHDFFSGLEWKKLMVKSLKPLYKPPQKDDNFDPKVAEANLPVGKGNATNFDFSQIEYASKNDLFQS